MAAPPDENESCPFVAPFYEARSPWGIRVEAMATARRLELLFGNYVLRARTAAFAAALLIWVFGTSIAPPGKRTVLLSA